MNNLFVDDDFDKLKTNDIKEIKARDLDIFPCSVSDIREFIETYHYSHNINGVKVSCCFKVMYLNNLVGGYCLA